MEPKVSGIDGKTGRGRGNTRRDNNEMITYFMPN